MIVSFISIDEEDNKIEYTSHADIDDNKIIFKDKSTNDTNIMVYQINDSLFLKRYGMIDMLMEYKLDCNTIGYYKNQDGIEFEFILHTNYLEIKDNKYIVDYEMIVGNDIVSKITFVLEILEK